MITHRLILGLMFMKEVKMLSKNCVKNAKEKELVTSPKQATCV